jgi:putative redox protein
VEGQQFLGITPSGHAVPFDSDRERNTAAGPMEMLMLALAACAGTDVVIILGKKRQKLESLEIVVSGERAAEPPKVWTHVEVLFRLRGELEEKAVRDAIDLSETKYCSVAATLKQAGKVSFRYEINPSGE